MSSHRRRQPAALPNSCRTRPAVRAAARSAFTAGLNRILLVAAWIALVSGVIALATIGPKDFVAATTEE